MGELQNFKFQKKYYSIRLNHRNAMVPTLLLYLDKEKSYSRNTILLKNVFFFPV